MKLTNIKGIGPKKQAKLNEMGIFDVGEFIEYLPRYYEDRSNLVYIENSVDGEKQYFELEITNAARTYFFKGNMSITRVVAKDDTSNINLVWYNDRFSPQSLQIGEKYKFFGKIDKSKKQISNPLFSKLNDDYIGGIYPIYSVIKGLSKKEFIQFKDRIFEKIKDKIDYIPDNILEEENLVDINHMYRILHRPKSYLELYKAKLSYITRNLVIENLANKVFNNKDDKYIKFKVYSIKPYIDSLDFTLTTSQQQVLAEISNDMYSDKGYVEVSTDKVICRVCDDFKVDFFEKDGTPVCLEYRGKRSSGQEISEEVKALLAAEGHAVNDGGVDYAIQSETPLCSRDLKNNIFPNRQFAEYAPMSYYKSSLFCLLKKPFGDARRHTFNNVIILIIS